MVGSVLRVCFALTLAAYMLMNWVVCGLLMLCSCLSERSRGGWARISSRRAFSATLFF
eukprot:COSAG03_NODE_15470_length_430_cov_0.725076_1_plen_57_part_01